MISRSLRTGSRSNATRCRRFGGFFEVEEKLQEVESLEEQLARPEVWGDQQRATDLQRRRSRLQEDIELAGELTTLAEDAATLLELAREGEDVVGELGTAVEELALKTEEAELSTLLTGEHDAAEALLEIHPGAGGTESQDWALMLLRMYTRWAERHGFKIETLDYQDGEEAGIKSVTLAIRGPRAYGYLRAERGVHRLVRISPFDAQARRHTSFASVDVLPELQDVEVEVDEKELRVDTYRSSGAGGQHVNVTDSAVRLTHLPTGIVVTCQNERSQHRNKDVAMKILRAKLYDLAIRKAEEAMAQEVGEKKKIEWGHQIRSYVLAPYRLVKDHRSGHEVGDADRILDGDLDGFIRAALAVLRNPTAAPDARPSA